MLSLEKNKNVKIITIKNSKIILKKYCSLFKIMQKSFWFDEYLTINRSGISTVPNILIVSYAYVFDL